MKKNIIKEDFVNNAVNILGKMKKLKRQGWVNRNIKNPESDAEHSFSLAMLVLLLAPENLDLLKCLKMALIHDLPEVFCGDFVPNEIEEKLKNELENKAMLNVSVQLKQHEFLKLFYEFEKAETPEAKFVKALDRVDNVFTAKFYEKEQGTDLVDEFAQSAKQRCAKLDDETQQKLLNVLQILGRK